MTWSGKFKIEKDEKNKGHFLLGKLEKVYFKQRRETFRRSKAMDIPVFQKNPFGSIPSNDSLDEVFEENNNNRKESVISFETTKGNLSNKELSLGCLKY